MSSLRSRLKSKPSSLTVVALLLVVALFAPSVTPLFAQSTGQIYYVYDSLGRLVGVVDQQGNAATYNYDAVGNILSIERFNISDIPGQIGVTLVSPSKGKVGTPVAIFGKGFSATPAENSVSFNGTAATIVSAAPNRIVTSVPAGATTGPIAVTTPLGSTTSAAVFRVLGVITVSPSSATLFVNGTQQFQAQEAGAPTTNVRWAVNGIIGGDSSVGTISTAGLYTAPATVPSRLQVTITASHREDPTLSASASVTVEPPIPLFITSAGVSVGLAEPPRTVDKNVTGAVSVQVATAAPPAFVASSVAVAVAPVITSVSPGSGARGASNFLITVTGSGFTGATALSFLLNNAVDGNVTVASLTVNADDTQATAEISIASGAATGARVVRITTPGGSSTAAGTGGNLFTVQ